VDSTCFPHSYLPGYYQLPTTFNNPSTSFRSLFGTRAMPFEQLRVRYIKIHKAYQNSYRTATEEYTKPSRTCPGSGAKQSRRICEAKTNRKRRNSEQKARQSEDKAKKVSILPNNFEAKPRFLPFSPKNSYFCRTNENSY